MPGTPGARTGLASILTGDGATAYRTTINAIKDWLEGNAAITSSGLLGARPTSSPGSPGIIGRRYRATDAFATFRDTGTGWELEAQTPQVVTALPTGTGIPFDGQEVFFLADATDGILWHARYRAASPFASKWDVLEAMPWVKYVATQQSLPPTDALYHDLTTVGPQLTIPVVGDYRIDHGAVMLSGAADSAWASVKFSATEASDADAARAVQVSTAPGLPFSAPERTVKTIAAGTVVKQRYRNGGAQTATWQDRWLRVTPLRIG
jgi:hypothetical protein